MLSLSVAPSQQVKIVAGQHPQRRRCFLHFGQRSCNGWVIDRPPNQSAERIEGRKEKEFDARVTTRARVNTFMNKFRKLGFVEYNGDIKVHPSLLNVVLHN